MMIVPGADVGAGVLSPFVVPAGGTGTRMGSASVMVQTR